MARRRNSGDQFSVTGPGLDPAPSYEDYGPALSRSVTAAEVGQRKGIVDTWYVRDANGDPIAYSIHDERGVRTRGRS